MQYIPELTWILFLRILDEQESQESERAKSEAKEFVWSISSPYRWQDWGAPYEPSLFSNNEAHQGWKRHELESQDEGFLLDFINRDLFPYLKSLAANHQATARQKVISEIAANIGHTRIDTDYNLAEVLNRVHQISIANIDPTHIFPLSQVYEGLLLRMGHKSNDGGQFFTPREIVRVMVRAIDPQPGETVYDPCCGTGGFLAEAYRRARQNQESLVSTTDSLIERQGGYYGREKENLVYPLALANLILNGMNEPHIWHGNTLTGQEIYGELFEAAPTQFDVILTNPPFGGKESQQAQTGFSFKSSSTQLLFLQHVIDRLKPNGRCAVVVDEGILFRNDTAFVQTKRKLLDECDVWCIISLPVGTFINAGASIKTDILFFTKGKPTENLWYYDLSHIKIGKATPLAAEHFHEFFELLPHFSDSERSWTVTRKQIEDNGYDLKAVNPRSEGYHDDRTLDDLLALMEERDREVRDALQALKSFPH